MGWFSRPEKKNATKDGPVSSDELFDEAFQRKLESLVLLSRKAPRGQRRAERRTKKIGAGVEFADHRAYHPGDDLRRLDVNVYRRHDKLLLRLADELEDLSIDFVLDKSLSMGFGGGAKLRCAKRVTAALAYVALAHLDRVTLTAASQTEFVRLPEMRGKGGIFKVFRFLRGVDAGGATDLASALEKVALLRRRKGTVVVVSDLFDPEGFERAINALRFHRIEPLVVHIVDEADFTPWLRGDVLITDCETGDVREVTVTDGFVRKLRDEHEQFRLRAERFCKSKSVSYVSADVSLPIDELMLRVFRSGMFLSASSGA